MRNYFTKKELACKHCGLINFDDDTLALINRVRHKFGNPMIVTSACRCRKHNKNVGGKSKSVHITTVRISCKAVDVKCINNEDRWVLFDLFKEEGIQRIGLAKNFIHADTDLTRPHPRLWLY